MKAHHWLATFLDPYYKRFEFLPTGTRDEITFKRRLLTDIDKWVMQQMERSVSIVSENQEFKSLQKRARLEISKDPFSNFRDGATNNVLLNNHSSPGNCDPQLLRQVCLFFNTNVDIFSGIF